MINNLMPGTNIPYGDNKNVTSNIKMMINATNGITLNQLCTITNLESSTIQNWVKRGFVFKPINKKYFEKHLARILIIKSLRDCMLIEEISELMSLLNGELENENDDIISDMTLYEYFCLALLELDEVSLSYKHIDACTDKVLKQYDGPEINKLNNALNIMVYAYIAGQCTNIVRNNLQSLKNY